MPAVPADTPAAAPVRSSFLVVIAGWLIPGAGHFLLRRKGRAVIIFATVLVAFLTGVLMRGPLFQPTGSGDLLSRLIQTAGFVGDVAAGLLYFAATLFGYGPPDQATHVADYGSKFLVAAGLLNVLGMVDAYEIATRQKD